MNKEELISSGLLESYVLGNISDEESVMIQNMCRRYPELLKEIEEIEKTLMDFSAGIAPPLKTGLKEEITSKLSFGKTESKVLPLKNEKIRLYRFGMAASLLLFVTSLVYNVLLQQKVNSMSTELAQLNQAKSFMADEMKVQQASIKTMNEQLQVIAHPHIKTIALKGMNSLDKKSAMIHWNMETHEVYFNASLLPGSPPDRQYQLWAIVNGQPVDAGMIDIKDTASVFQKMKTIDGAQAFAVTIEKMGGSPVPTMETMCFIGNV